MITASIVAYHTPINELSHLLECIVHSNIDVLYLVDNSSNDSLRELSSMSRKIVYIYSDNLGFGHGHNIAIQKSIAVNADYHIVINPDMYWEGKVIEELQEFMNHHPDCGLVMPKVLYPTGEIHLILLSGFFIAVILSRVIIPRILIISLRKRLFDALDVRKVHKKPVSRLSIEQPIYRWYISRHGTKKT